MSLRPPSRIYTGLTEPMLIAGVEPRLLLMNVGLFCVILILFHAWWWVACTWVIHQALKPMSRNDPFVRRVYLLYQRQADRYEPYPEASPRRGLRPISAGRGVVG